MSERGQTRAPAPVASGGAPRRAVRRLGALARRIAVLFGVAQHWVPPAG